MTGNGNGNGNGATHRRWSFPWGKTRSGENDRSPFRRLALQLHFELSGPGDRSVLLVSPDASDLSANGSVILAECLADEFKRPVLLIDASPKDPRISRMLNCSASRGFSDLVADFELLPPPVLPTNTDNLFFLPAGSGAGSPDQAPADPKTIVETLEQAYDFVVFNGGSMLQDSAALAFAPFVGRVLLLAAENVTMQEDLTAARQTLFHCKAHNVGLVLTSQSD